MLPPASKLGKILPLISEISKISSPTSKITLTVLPFILIDTKIHNNIASKIINNILSSNFKISNCRLRLPVLKNLTFLFVNLKISKKGCVQLLN